MFLKYWTYFALFAIATSTQLKRLSQGKYVITGKSCGVQTTIKYLDNIPQNINDFPCSNIELKTELHSKATGDKAKLSRIY